MPSARRTTRWGATVGRNSVGPSELRNNVAGAGLTGGAGTALTVQTDDSSLEVVGDQVRNKAGGTTLNHLAASAKPPVYGGIDVTAAYAADQILAQEFCSLVMASGSGGRIFAPGVASPKTTMAAPAASLAFVPLLGGVYDSVNATILPRCCVPATRTSIKGRYLAFADAPLVGTTERLTLGVTFIAGTILQATWDKFGSETETTRDDNATVAVIVDDAENVQSYNCAAAGDATYTDSLVDADLSAGIYWEIIIEYGTADDTADDLQITIKVNGNTILNGVAPASVSGGGPPVPFLLFNQSGIVTDVFCKIEKVA